MSSNKTPNLNLHSWTGNDKVLRSEFVDNFTKIDNKFNASNGHSHDGNAGSGSKIAASSVDYSSDKNVKEALDELFQSANRYIKSIADTIGEPYDETGSATLYNMNYYDSRVFEEDVKIRRAITAKHGVVPYPSTVSDLKDAILSIPYNLEPQGTADAIDVASGETFLNRTAALITGSRQLLSDKSYSPKASNTSIPNAIHDNSYIKGEPNLIPENIRANTTIYGVTGTYTPIPGYNIGNTIDSSSLVHPYIMSSENIQNNNFRYICPQGNVWTATKEISQYLVQNLNYPDMKFYFSPHTDIRSMKIDFNGFYFLTHDMLYCYDYLKLTHKWGIRIADVIPAGDTIVEICTNHLGEVIIITQKGRIYILDYKTGSVSDMYKIQEQYTYPINISSVRQRFSCDDIVLLDNTNNICLYIDSDINGDNTARVLYEKDKNILEITDVITTDTQDSYILRNTYGSNTPTKTARIHHYNYRTANSNTIALEIGSVTMDSVPKRLYRIENQVFLITSDTEIVIYDCNTDLVLLREKINLAATVPAIDNNESIYTNNKKYTLSKSTNKYLVHYNPDNITFNSKSTNEILYNISNTTLDKIL